MFNSILLYIQNRIFTKGLISSIFYNEFLSGYWNSFYQDNIMEKLTIIIFFTFQKSHREHFVYIILLCSIILFFFTTKTGQILKQNLPCCVLFILLNRICLIFSIRCCYINFRFLSLTVFEKFSCNLRE